MRKQTLLIGAVVAVIVGGCLWLLLDSKQATPIAVNTRTAATTQQLPTSNIDTSQQEPERSLFDEPGETPISDNGFDCDSYRDADLAADKYSSEQWLASLGFRSETSDRSYYQMDNALLEALAEQGDAQAALALGLNLRVQSYGLGESWPAESSFTIDLLTPPPESTLQQELLDRSRALLLRSAILGKPAALTELTASYEEELRWRESNNTLTDWIRSDLEMKIAVNSAMQLALLEEDADTISQPISPPAGKEKETQARSDLAISRFKEAQYEALGEVTAFETPPAIKAAQLRIDAYTNQCEPR